MDNLILEGKRYVALFQYAQKVDDTKTHTYSCWHPSPDMWWEGRVKITDTQTGIDSRAFFETYHRNINGSIKSESLEESLLLVRGINQDGEYVSYPMGNGVVRDRKKVIDYLLGRMHEDALVLGRNMVFPHIKIPLLEQHELVERGYALEKSTVI